MLTPLTRSHVPVAVVAASLCAAACLLAVPAQAAAPAAAAPAVAVTELPSNATLLVDGGVAAGNAFRTPLDGTTTPWVWFRGHRVNLPTPKGNGTVDGLSLAGYALGSVTTSRGSSAVRWSITGPVRTSLSAADTSYVAGTNGRGDAVVIVPDPSGSGNDLATLARADGSTASYGRVGNAIGLTLKGQTTVFDVTADGKPRWYLTPPGGPRVRLPYDSLSNSCAAPINDAGYLVYRRTDLESKVMLRDPDGTVHDTGLDYLDCRQSLVSQRGHVAGSINRPDGSAHVGLYRDGRLTDLGLPPGGGTAYAVAVNDKDEVLAGNTDSQGRERVAVWRAGSWMPLPIPAPAADVAVAYGTDINNTGQAIGNYITVVDGVQTDHSVLWTLPPAS